MDRNTVWFSRAKLMLRQVSVSGLALMDKVGAGGTALAGQNCEARRPSLDSIRRDLALAASVARQLDDMAQRDGTKVVFIARAGQDLGQHGLRYSHLGIAYRDDAALDGRGAWRVVHKLNECGSSRSTLHRQGLAEFFGAGHQHDADFQQLDQPCQRRLVVLVGQLPGGRRKQEERQDEDARREIGQQFWLDGGPVRRLEGQQHHHGVLQHVVVERAEELGDEQRGEAARAQQAGLVAHGGSLSDSGRSGGF